MMNILKHVFIVAVSLFLMLGVPFLTSDYFKAIVEGTDAVSSASVIIDQPSGDYVVLLNLDKHTDKENLAMWYDFFEGKEIDFIFEDIDCMTAKSDINGTTMAQSYRSRLPENQMKLNTIDGTLMLSRAEHGKFDIIVLSEELADFYTASTVYDRDNVAVLHVKGVTE